MQEFHQARLALEAGLPEILARTGFIAVANGPKDLSRRYKAHLSASLRKKT